jgi:hypothetical protein
MLFGFLIMGDIHQSTALMQHDLGIVDGILLQMFYVLLSMQLLITGLFNSCSGNCSCTKAFPEFPRNNSARKKVKQCLWRKQYCVVLFPCQSCDYSSSTDP